MSVKQTISYAIKKPCVRTLMAVIPVHVKVDILGMDSNALVNNCNHITASVMDIGLAKLLYAW